MSWTLPCFVQESWSNHILWLTEPSRSCSCIFLENLALSIADLIIIIVKYHYYIGIVYNVFRNCYIRCSESCLLSCPLNIFTAQARLNCWELFIISWNQETRYLVQGLWGSVREKKQWQTSLGCYVQYWLMRSKHLKDM